MNTINKLFSYYVAFIVIVIVVSHNSEPIVQNEPFIKGYLSFLSLYCAAYLLPKLGNGKNVEPHFQHVLVIYFCALSGTVILLDTFGLL